MFLSKFFLELVLFIVFITPKYAFKNKISSKILAKVNDKVLYEKDLNIFDNENKSIITKDYAKKWVEKNLILSELEKIKTEHEHEIKQNLLDYEYTLRKNFYIEKAIKKHINFEVSEKEIVDYYKTNKTDFELKENIVKGRFAIFSKNITNANNLKSLFISSKAEDNEELIKFCKQNAKSYFLNSNVWIKFEQMIEGTPLQTNSNKLKLLNQIKKKKVYRLIGTDNIYYFEIFDYKISDEISPMELVKPKIKEIIIFKNKIKLKEDLLKKLLEDAKKKHSYEIYI